MVTPDTRRIDDAHYEALVGVPITTLADDERRRDRT